MCSVETNICLCTLLGPTALTEDERDPDEADSPGQGIFNRKFNKDFAYENKIPNLSVAIFSTTNSLVPRCIIQSRRLNQKKTQLKMASKCLPLSLLFNLWPNSVNSNITLHFTTCSL